MSLDRGDEVHGTGAHGDGAAFAEVVTTAGAGPLRLAAPATKRIAFCGFWEVTRDMAPVNDPSWEIWGCNHGFPYLPRLTGSTETRWDVWFDVHDPAWSAKTMKPEVWADMERFLKTRHGKPIFMQKHYPEYPDSVPFPLDEIEARFPVTANREWQRYNTNALTYAISLALLRGVTELAIYGADMRGDEEYAAQRPAVEYWLGRAEGMGVKLIVPPQSGLLNPDGIDYGYAEDSSAWVEMRRALEADLARFEQERQLAQDRFQAFDGSAQVARDMIRRIDQRRRGGGIL